MLVACFLNVAHETMSLIHKSINAITVLSKQKISAKKVSKLTKNLF